MARGKSNLMVLILMIAGIILTSLGLLGFKYTPLFRFLFMGGVCVGMAFMFKSLCQKNVYWYGAGLATIFLSMFASYYPGVEDASFWKALGAAALCTIFDGTFIFFMLYLVARKTGMITNNTEGSK